MQEHKGIRRILMLAAHDPTLDPRVDWEATWAAKEFDVEVLGLQPWGTQKPAEEIRNGYRIKRLTRSSETIHTLSFLFQILKFQPKFIRVGLFVLFAILWPFLLIFEVGIRLARSVLKAMRSFVRSIIRPQLITIRLTTIALHKLFEFDNSKRSLNLTSAPSQSPGLAITFRFRAFKSVIKDHFGPVSSQFWAEIYNMPEKPDVIHCNDLETLLVGIRAKRVWGVKVIYDAHEYWPYSDPDAPWYQVVFFRFYERMLIKQCNHVITVNPLLAKVIAEAYGLREVLSVPNVEPKCASRRRIGGEGPIAKLALGRVKFLYQGNFAPERGIVEVLQAWKVLNSTHACLFLRGPDNRWKQECERTAAQLGVLNQSVHFLPPVSEDELVSAAMEADIGIVPYKPLLAGYKYCCPNKLSQYMFAGLMIICNDLPYVRQVLEQSKSGLWYDSSRPESIVETLSKAVEDTTLRIECGRRALEFAETEFNWQAYYPVLRNAYLN